MGPEGAGGRRDRGRAAAAMAAGARAVVLGDVPASETLAGVVDGLKDASREKEESSTLGSVLDATRAFASVFASDKAALRNDVAAALRGFAAGEKENERGLGRDAPGAPAALTDALVTRRDARLFDAAWSVAARSAAARASVPAYARVASVAAPPEPFAMYAFEKSGTLLAFSRRERLSFRANAIARWSSSPSWAPRTSRA